MAAQTLTLFSARDAKTKFGELLDTALGRPVGITKHDRLTAYLVSKYEYETMVERIQELEDRLWLIKADAARKDGFVSSDEVDAFLVDIGNLNDESSNDQTGHDFSKGSGRKTI